MNWIYSEKLSILNIANIFFGAFFGFFVMVMVSCAIISLILKRFNQNEEIRRISKKAYTDFYLIKNTMKDKMISSMIFEIKEVSKLVYPNKKYPLYELSINDILSGLMILSKSLKKVVDHPLFKDLKNVHIATFISFEENYAKPIYKLYNHKVFKTFYKSYKTVRMVLNLINPIFYIKKIIYLSAFKQGKKDLILIGLDFVGNCFYEIYQNNEEKLE